MNKIAIENERVVRALLTHTVLAISKEIIGCSILLDLCDDDNLNAEKFKKELASKIDDLVKDFLGNRINCIKTKGNSTIN